MATGMAIGGLVLSAAGLYQSYEGQRKAGAAGRKAANWEADIHDQEAKFAEYEKELALKQQALIKDRAVGEVTATAAGQGFRVNVGTNKKLVWETINLADYDASIIRWKGNVNVWREQAIAGQLRAAGGTAGTIGNIRATGTLLGGGASLLTAGSQLYTQMRGPQNYTTMSGGLPTRS